MITYSGTFDLPVAPAAAMTALSDIRRTAHCLPGASLDEPGPDGLYSGQLVVAFGPKKIKFNGTLACEFDHTALRGVLRGRGSGVVRNSGVAVTAIFTVAEGPTPGESLVGFSLEAEFGGMLADLAATAGTALTNVLLDDFSRNLRAELTSPTAGDGPRGALAAHSMAWRALRSSWTGRPSAPDEKE